jgi:hypothetical protein
VLELGGLAQHVDERLAMLDDERRLGLCPSAARGQNLGKATPSGTAARISHRERPPRTRVDKPTLGTLIDADEGTTEANSDGMVVGAHALAEALAEANRLLALY